MQSVTIDDLKKLVSFGLSAGELVAGLSNGFGFDDLRKVLECVTKFGSFSHAKLALDEYRGMTDEQAMELDQFIVSEFDIADDKVEVVVENALMFLVSLHALVNSLLPKAALSEKS